MSAFEPAFVLGRSCFRIVDQLLIRLVEDSPNGVKPSPLPNLLRISSDLSFDEILMSTPKAARPLMNYLFGTEVNFVQ